MQGGGLVGPPSAVQAEEPSSTRGRRERGRGCPGDTGPPHSVRPPLWGPPQVEWAYRPPQPGCGEGPGAAGLRQSTRLSRVPFCPGCSAPREGGPRHPPPSLSVGAAVTRLCGSCHARGSAGPRALQPPHSPPPLSGQQVRHLREGVGALPRGCGEGPPRPGPPPSSADNRERLRASSSVTPRPARLHQGWVLPRHWGLSGVSSHLVTLLVRRTRPPPHCGALPAHSTEPGQGP